MEQKERKLLSRVGAAFMLGLSLFNLGSAWNKSREGELPKKARNIRKKESEQLKSETQQIADIAEDEASVVIAEQEAQKQVQQVQQSENLSNRELAVRYGAFAVWTISAGVFFSSMIFNQPFALGKGVLSLLPGVPHVATMSLEPTKSNFSSGESVALRLMLDSNGESVNAAKVVIIFNPEELDFYHGEPVVDSFENIKVDKVDQEKGMIEVSLSNEKKSKKYRGEQIMAIYLNTRKEKQNSKVELSKKNSFVLNSAIEGANILGRVKNAEVIVK